MASVISSAVIQKDMSPSAAETDFSRLTFAVLFEAVSWIAMPIYAWLVYDGFTHTRSLARYALRLAALAIAAEVPYDLATSGRPWDMSSQNPVWALLVALAVLWLIGTVKTLERAARVGLALAVAIAGALWLFLFNVDLRLGLMPGGVLILLFVLVFRFLERRQNTMMMVGALIGAVALVLPAFGFVILHFRNGRLGPARAGDKYIFYFLYPLCLLAGGLYRTLAP